MSGVYPFGFTVLFLLLYYRSFVTLFNPSA